MLKRVIPDLPHVPSAKRHKCQETLQIPPGCEIGNISNRTRGSFGNYF